MERIIFEDKYYDFSWGSFLVSSLIHTACLYALIGEDNHSEKKANLLKTHAIEIEFIPPTEKNTQENSKTNQHPATVSLKQNKQVVEYKKPIAAVIKKAVTAKKIIKSKTTAVNKSVVKKMPVKQISHEKIKVSALSPTTTSFIKSNQPHSISKTTIPMNDNVSKDSVKIEKPLSLTKDVGILKRVKPEYPKMAQKMGKEGKVILRILVGADGKPKSIHLIEAESLDSFNKSALKAAWSYRFSPAIEQGRAVESYKNIIIYFRLN